MGSESFSNDSQRPPGLRTTGEPPACSLLCRPSHSDSTGLGLGTEPCLFMDTPGDSDVGGLRNTALLNSLPFAISSFSQNCNVLNVDARQKAY